MSKNLKAIALGYGSKDDSLASIKSSLAELEDLVYSLGWSLVGSTFQKSSSTKAGTLIGSGKIEEIKNLVEETQAEVLAVDYTLTGSQIRNLNKELGIIVADRNQIIIDIFAKRAKSKEGKLQVELARLLDELPRTIGGWHGSLSRLGGGIGTRGPGESALESDRRAIRNRITQLKKKLKTIETHRQQSKKQRNRGLTLALVGYTNAGKSSLLEGLTKSKTYVEDQLFATLDPLTKKFFIEGLGSVTLTDTVGFINKIPTHLIEAFKATLEESKDADILLHVIDASDPDASDKSDFVDNLISSFGWKEQKTLYIYNKSDLLELNQKRTLAKRTPFVLTSTKNHEGFEKLKLLIKDLAEEKLLERDFFIPKEERQKKELLAKEAKVLSLEESSVGTVARVLIRPESLEKWTAYLC